MQLLRFLAVRLAVGIVATSFVFHGVVAARADLAALELLVLQPRKDKKGTLTYKETTLKLNSLAGRKPLVLLYWNPAVPAAVDELRRFHTFASGQANSGIVFLTVARALDDHERATIEMVARQVGLSLPILLDSQFAAARAIRAQFLPAYYGLDERGQERLAGFSSLRDEVAGGGTLADRLSSARGTLPNLVPPEPRVLREGDLAPDFELPDLNGKPVRLYSLLGSKPVLLVFWSAYCPHCQKEMPRIQRFLDNRAGAYTPVTVTRIVAAEDRLQTENYLQAAGIRLPVLVDGGAVLAKYGIKGIPQWMVLDAQGRILTIQTGEKAGLEGLLARWAARKN